MKRPSLQLIARSRRSRGFLVDSNVLLDIATGEEDWAAWSREALVRCVQAGPLVINPIIYAETSVGYSSIEKMDQAFPESLYRRENLPWAAGFVAGKQHLAYRRRGGTRNTPLPDFYIGAHAAVAGLVLLTRDATIYRTYFPTVELLTPA